MSSITYNFYICKFCEYIYYDDDDIDCKKCNNSCCILLFQAENKTKALKQKREKYGIKINIK